MAAGICVLALHGLLILGLLADFSVKPPPVRQRTVQVALLLPKPLPRLPPLPLPRFSQEPQIVAIQPRISIAQPPSPDAVRAVPPVRGPAAPEPAQGPVAPPLPPMDYLSRLEAHLNAYKNYPYDARIHHQEGTVDLRFSLDRSGHVLSYEVAGSSGSALLDNEAREMIRRADPFPPVPADYRGETLDLTVPLVFALH
ncbi:MAG TPA: energy transducer TonB [Rhizomicrobium sp.]|nr:energy transducer TonB [Rhizomicrobium sp.]